MSGRRPTNQWPIRAYVGQVPRVRTEARRDCAPGETVPTDDLDIYEDSVIGTAEANSLHLPPCVSIITASGLMPHRLERPFRHSWPRRVVQQLPPLLWRSRENLAT